MKILQPVTEIYTFNLEAALKKWTSSYSVQCSRGVYEIVRDYRGKFYRCTVTENEAMALIERIPLLPVHNEQGVTYLSEKAIYAKILVLRAKIFEAKIESDTENEMEVLIKEMGAFHNLLNMKK